MSKHFWLIQRGSFHNLESATKFLGNSPQHLISLDYMGAAEFEWGAIPKAYRRIMGQYDKYNLHITDLITSNGVPFCLYCMNSRYTQTLEEIKAYLKKPYRTKERTDIDTHFTTKCLFEIDYYKYQLRTNFWWCIDIAKYNDDVGDWIAFVGTTDRQNAFKRVINSDYTNWWMKKPKEDREQDIIDSF